jgi:hypothetical protein
MKKEQTNVIIEKEELSVLRKAVIDRFRDSVKDVEDGFERKLNSNLSNYRSLYNEIDDAVSLASIGIKSTKPLAVLFHFSKTGPQAFRRKFINALYKYAFGYDRNKFLSLKAKVLTPSLADRQLRNIEGYWESYYDKDNTFKEKLLANHNATLGVVAMTIKGKDINHAEVDFLSTQSSGKGTVEIQGANMVFQLKDSANQSTFMIMNCGVDIENHPGHLKYAAGLFLHINEFGSPKAGICVMEYFDKKRFNEKNKDRFEVTEIDLADPKIKLNFRGNEEIRLNTNGDIRLRRLKLFFQRERNNTDVNISNFATVNPFEFTT